MTRNYISIERKLPIINGFVQVPDGEITLRNTVTPTEAEAAVVGSADTQISGDQRTDRSWLVLPSYNLEDGLSVDYYDKLRDA